MSFSSCRTTVSRISALAAALVVAIAISCSEDNTLQENQRRVSDALDALAADLVENRPADTTEYTELLKSHLKTHPSFFGSAVALVDPSGAVITSPYVYRTNDDFDSKDLAAPSYDIEAQDWFTEPIAANAGVWTEPYFDAGGGEIWMITRSVPVRDSQGLFAVVTTDLAVDNPNQ